MARKNPLITGEVHHVFTKSIANFKILNGKEDYLRMIGLIRYYQIEKPSVKFSYVVRTKKILKQYNLDAHKKECQNLVDIVAYCLMPTHLHLVLKQTMDNGISVYLSNILNGYARYFNIKYNRKGPLWEGKFKNVLVDSDDQLIHLTRYVHLNPVTANLVDKPDMWRASSYNEYLHGIEEADCFCSYQGVLDIDSKTYQTFVENRIAYQRELAKIKNLLLE